MLDSLAAVSCVSARSCTAVGAYGLAGQTLVESWNGTRWAIVPSPSTGGANAFDQLNSVSCVSVSSCTAVGTYGVTRKTLVESWNGTRWAIVPSPNPPPPPPSSAGNALMGVSCTSAAMCIAVGTPAREGSPPHIGALAELGTSAR